MGRFVPQQQYTPYGGGVHQPLAESFFPFLSAERKLPELCKRHPRLYYSHDLKQEICHWVNNNEALEIPTDVATSFFLNNEQSVVLPADFEKKEDVKDDAKPVDKYSARVMLLSPLKTDEKRHTMQKVR